jgi:hypothetical protein
VCATRPWRTVTSSTARAASLNCAEGDRRCEPPVQRVQLRDPPLRLRGVLDSFGVVLCLLCGASARGCAEPARCGDQAEPQQRLQTLRPAHSGSASKRRPPQALGARTCWRGRPGCARICAKVDRPFSSSAFVKLQARPRLSARASTRTLRRRRAGRLASVTSPKCYWTTRRTKRDRRWSMAATEGPDPASVSPCHHRSLGCYSVTEGSSRLPQRQGPVGEGKWHHSCEICPIFVDSKVAERSRVSPLLVDVASYVCERYETLCSTFPAHLSLGRCIFDGAAARLPLAMASQNGVPVRSASARDITGPGRRPRAPSLRCAQVRSAGIWTRMPKQNPADVPLAVIPHHHAAPLTSRSKYAFKCAQRGVSRQHGCSHARHSCG